MSGIPRGIDHIETLVWILSGTMSITFRRTRRRTYIRMALNMSSKRRRIRGALDMPYLCSGTFMALIRPTFLCTPAFCAYMFLRRVSCFVFCKVLAVLCFCSLWACRNLGSLSLWWINKYNDGADRLDDTEAHIIRYSCYTSNNAAKREVTAIQKPIQLLQKTVQQLKNTVQRPTKSTQKLFSQTCCLQTARVPCFCSSLHVVSGLLGLGLLLVRAVASDPYSCIRSTIPSCSSSNRAVVRRTMSVQ